MNYILSKKKIVWILLLVLILINSKIFSKILVLPFKTEKNIDKSYFWFSRAFSYYLSTKLNSININSFTDAEVDRIITENSINFPYRFTKASAIKIGLRNNAKKIIWGEIKSSEVNGLDTTITIRSYIIDTISFKQYYLPIIKSKVKNISLIQRELFNIIIRKLEIKPECINDKLLKFTNQSYELFIKSLISHNIKEKEYLLKNSLNLVKNKNVKQNSDLINFKLASLYLDINKFDLVSKHLDKIDSKSIISKNKLFLQALINSNNEKYHIAISEFLKLKRNSSFDDLIDNNLGVLYIKTEDFSKAEQYLLDAIKKNISLISYINLLNLYLKGSNSKKLKSVVIETLNYYPKDINSISLLYHFINQDKNKNILFNLFTEIIEKDTIIDYYKLELKLQLKNPFSSLIKNNSFKPDEIDIKFFTLEDFLQKLELYPFNYKTHLTISKIYQKRKQFRKAEIYGIFAMFLNRSNQTINNLFELYKLLGNSSKTRELKVELDLIQKR